MRCADLASPGTGANRPMVTPLARALSILSAFTCHEQWLRNSDIAQRTNLPASTVTRLTRTLISLGYLVHATETRRFRLAAPVLNLGYRTAVNAEIQRMAHEQMQRFASRHDVHIHLSTRDRLDLIVIDSCRTHTLPTALQPGIGTRFDLVSSPAGWALLAGLPDTERDYLLQSAKRRSIPEWPHLRRRSNAALRQIREDGFCVVPGASGQPMTVIAAPIKLAGQPPLAISCMRPSMLMGRPCNAKKLGPALARMTREIRLSGNKHEHPPIRTTHIN